LIPELDELGDDEFDKSGEPVRSLQPGQVPLPSDE
jgi:hypothetical protein